MWKMHVLVGRKSMTPVGEVIATAKDLGNLRIGDSGVLPNQKGDFFLFWKYNAEHEIRERHPDDKITV